MLPHSPSEPPVIPPHMLLSRFASPCIAYRYRVIFGLWPLPGDVPVDHIPRIYMCGRVLWHSLRTTFGRWGLGVFLSVLHVCRSSLHWKDNLYNLASSTSLVLLNLWNARPLCLHCLSNTPSWGWGQLSVLGFEGGDQEF